MIFYIALQQEFHARGPAAVMGCWVVKGGSKTANEADDGHMDIVRLRDEILLSDLTYLHRAVVIHTRSRKAMANFLSEMLEEQSNINHLNQHLWKRYESTTIHSFDAGGAVPDALMTIKCRRSNSPSFLEMKVYKDTTFSWVSFLASKTLLSCFIFFSSYEHEYST